MKTHLAVLIESRMQQLCIDRAALGLRLGYRNPAKAAGRVYALCDGHITSTKSKNALRRLPEAIEVPAEVVHTAVDATLSFLAELKRQEDEKLRIARENEDAAWRATFKPHAVIQGERTTPASITMYAITGGAERWLKIGFDLSRPPITFVEQVLAALPSRLHLREDGEWILTFFGSALGFTINYSPDRAVRFDLKGNPVESLSKAIRPGKGWVSLKGENRIVNIGRT